MKWDYISFLPRRRRERALSCCGLACFRCCCRGLFCFCFCPCSLYPRGSEAGKGVQIEEPQGQPSEAPNLYSLSVLFSGSVVWELGLPSLWAPVWKKIALGQEKKEGFVLQISKLTARSLTHTAQHAQGRSHGSGECGGASWQKKKKKRFRGHALNWL